MALVVHELSGAYALDAVDGDERAWFEEHLPACAACRAEVRAFRAVAVELGRLAEAPPPAHLEAALLQRVVATDGDAGPLEPVPAADPVVGSVSPRPFGARGAIWGRHRWRWACAAAAAALAVAAGVSVRLVQLEGRVDRYREVAQVAGAPGARVVELEGPAGSARVILAATQGKALVTAPQLTPVGAEHTYQMWLLSEGAPTPGGLFRPGAEGRVSAVVDVDVPVGASGVGVTVEPRRGSRRPTTPVVLAGELVS